MVGISSFGLNQGEGIIKIEMHFPDKPAFRLWLNLPDVGVYPDQSGCRARSGSFADLHPLPPPPPASL